MEINFYSDCLHRCIVSGSIYIVKKTRRLSLLVFNLDIVYYISYVNICWQFRAKEPVWELWRGRYTVTEANEHAVQLAEFVLCVHWKCLSTTSCWSSGHTKLSIPQECLPKLSSVATDDRKLACYWRVLSLFLSDLLCIAPLLLLLVTLLPVHLKKKKKTCSPKNGGQVCNVSK